MFQSCSQTGGVTRSQFERMIDFLSLPVTVPEMEVVITCMYIYSITHCIIIIADSAEV